MNHKDEQFNAFKTYKAWVEHQLDMMLKCIQTDHGGEFLSKSQIAYLKEHGIKHQTSMPYSAQQNGQAERYQRTIINKAQSMCPASGLSDGFWSYAVRATILMDNDTLIKRTDYQTSQELWSGRKPNVSHLWVFGCSAWVHISKDK